MRTATRELVLSKVDWRADLEQYGLPPVLVSLLHELLSAHFSGAISPRLSDERLRLAKDYLRAGICFKGGSCEEHYDVVVFVPRDGGFFQLSRRYPGMTLRHLHEI
jgi:hypothetical protein